MNDRHRIGKFLQHVTSFTLVVFCLTALPLAGPVTEGFARPPKPTVVLDPGHGGSDTGVKGPGGTLEKDVTLHLARLVENRLKDRCQVILTRTGDYVLDTPDRTGRANHARADLFISLHVAGSYSRATRGLPVYYYTAPAVKAPARAPDTAAVTPWREIQKPHIPASGNLAQRIATRTAHLTTPHPHPVLPAPLAVLGGADMPAILMEAGYLTNPKQEKNLNDNKYLFKLATAISQGIEDFLNNPDTILSTDLRE